jgi:hypothetical protein
MNNGEAVRRFTELYGRETAWRHTALGKAKQLGGQALMGPLEIPGRQQGRGDHNPARGSWRA